MPADAQAEIERARARLLSGRGLGASEAEVDAHTTERPLYAGLPVAEQLERLHERTASARGDTVAMQRDLARTRDQLAADVDQIAARLDPRQSGASSARPLVVVGALALLLVLRAATRRGPVRREKRRERPGHKRVGEKGTKNAGITQERTPR